MPLLETKGAASAQGFGLTIGGTAANYIEDVFSTYLYTGTGSALTITNGINLSTNGGLVWMKGRSGATDHALYDTVRGATKDLVSNSTAAETTQATGLTSFATTGFSIGALAKLNTSSATYVSWTFREQAKFFDVVTYTGNGVGGRAISHNLGAVPGCIIVKRLDAASNWPTYHRSLSTPNNNAVLLNLTNAALGTGFWNNTAPTSTTFTVSTDADVNVNGGTYVAYLFAHDAGGFGLTGTDNVISCGSYTGNGSTGQLINLGYEPQWVLIKQTDATDQWAMIDNMRGWAQTDSATLCANTSSAENAVFSASGATSLDPQGFRLWNANGALNESGGTYIYIAIRRGPMKVPTTGTSIFNLSTYTGTGSNQLALDSGLVSDTYLIKRSSVATSGWKWMNRLIEYAPNTGSFDNPLALDSTSTAAESSANTFSFSRNKNYNYDYFEVAQDGSGNWAVSGSTYANYAFKRAPKFFDVVCYTGNGPGTQSVSHNLTVVPELVINKTRSSVNGWTVFQGSTTALNGFLRLNTNAAQNTGDTLTVSSTTITADSTLGFGMNTSGDTYLTYLFATCPGVSKVGRYTGTGTTLQVNCGFSAGSRFVMIKRIDSTGDWYVWDSARGIIAGNDPYLLINDTAVEVTGTDYVDTYSAGFEISSTAPAAINANGGTFIFLAIA